MRNMAKYMGFKTEKQYLEFRAKVLFFQDFRCLCNKPFLNHNNGEYQIHHINHDPKDNHRSNVQALCCDCHQLQHPDRNIREFIDQREF
jgi:hypothetical protein